MPALSKLGCPGGASQQPHALSVGRDWNFKHLFTGVQLRWPQKGTGGGQCHISPVLGGGDGTALRGEGTGDGVSKANAAVPNPLGIWHWPGPSQLPDPC